MKKVCFIFALLILIMFPLLWIPPVSGSENRTVGLFPLADSYVSLSSPENNYGKELYLQTEYEQPYNIVNASSFTVSPTTYWMQLYLPVNGKISGSFEVTQGGNKDIDFWIKNSDQTTTYDHGSRVTNRTFSFVAPYTGNFYLGFDNSFSVFTSKQVSLSDILLTMEPFNVICSPIFLQFNLSSIPPDATITSANLNMTFKSSEENVQSTVKSYYCSQNNWDEQTITYANAPFSEAYLSNSFSLDVSNVSSGDRLRWDITGDVVKGLTNEKLTEVLVIVGQGTPTGSIQFFSKESENKPMLEISYTYVSVTSLVSPSLLIQGQNVAVNVGTDPSQQVGQLKIQYSNDQIKWFDLETFSGGTAYYAWTPQITGQVYVRSLWETTWNDGSYYTLSSVNAIYIIPIYLLALIPVIIVVAIVGIWYWRRRKRRAKRTLPST